METQGMPVPADMLVTLIGEQAVEIRVLRAQNAQLSQSLASANARILEIGTTAESMGKTLQTLEAVNASLEAGRVDQGVAGGVAGE